MKDLKILKYNATPETRQKAKYAKKLHDEGFSNNQIATIMDHTRRYIIELRHLANNMEEENDK